MPPDGKLFSALYTSFAVRLRHPGLAAWVPLSAIGTSDLGNPGLKLDGAGKKEVIALEPVLGFEFVHPVKAEAGAPRQVGQTALQPETIDLVLHVLVGGVRSTVLGHLPLAESKSAELAKYIFSHGQELACAHVQAEVGTGPNVHILLVMMDLIGSAD